jgi:myosin heavy subunit
MPFNLKIKQLIVFKYYTILKGYPEHLNFEEFERRFSMFIVNNSNDSLPNHSHSNDDHKQACVNLIKIFDIDSAFFKFGTTQVKV